MKTKNLKLRKLGNNYMLVDSAGADVDITHVYTLNSVAAWLWGEASKGEFTAQPLADALCGKYEVSPEEALRDVEEQLAQWAEYGIVIR